MAYMTMFFNFFLCACFVLTFGGVFGDDVSFGEYELISFRNDIRELMSRKDIGLSLDSELVNELDIVFSWDLPLIAASVRLAFHDCTGEFPAKCNGCIISNARPNAGVVSGAIEPLSSICNEYKSNYSLSIADCWSLAATFGLELGSQKTTSDWIEINDFFDGDLDEDDFPSPSISPGDIPYYIGRIDCETAPETEEGVEEQFPGVRDGWNTIQDYFGDRFHTMTKKEIVALIAGGHSLGRGHLGASGRTGPWDFSPNTLDNGYSNDLLGKNRLLLPFNWQFGRFAPGNGPSQFFIDDDSLTDYDLPSDEAFLMLECDISLAYNRSYFIDNGIVNSDCMTRAFEYCELNFPNSIVLYPDEDSNDFPSVEICEERQCRMQCVGGDNELDEYIDNNFENIDDNYDSCPLAWITQFSMDNDELVETFLSAFNKLITSGYTILDDSYSDEYLNPDIDYLYELDVDYHSLHDCSGGGSSSSSSSDSHSQSRRHSRRHSRSRSSSSSRGRSRRGSSSSD